MRLTCHESGFEEALAPVRDHELKSSDCEHAWFETTALRGTQGQGPGVSP